LFGWAGAPCAAADEAAPLSAASPTPVASPDPSTAEFHLDTAPISFPVVNNTAFDVGEKLQFVIKYEFITAGTASLEVQEGPSVNNQRTMAIISKAESNSFISAFFRVRDYNASMVDRESLTSLSFHQNLHEGGYQVIRTTTFDYKHRSYNFERIRRGTKSNRTGAIEMPLLDILSSFYFVRTLPLRTGGEYSVTVFSDNETYPLLVKVGSKIDRIGVAAGKFDCLRIDPVIRGDAIFKAKEGKMTIWMTNDEKKMPVLIRTRVFIGAVDAELMSYEGTK